MTQLGQLGNGGLTASSLIFILLTVGGAVVALLRWFAIRVLSQIENHAARISQLESQLSNAPSHEDLSKMYESLNTLAQTVHQLVGENRGQSDTLRLILNRITQK